MPRKVTLIEAIGSDFVDKIARRNYIAVYMTIPM